MAQSHYEVLGVAADASREEITKGGLIGREGGGGGSQTTAPVSRFCKHLGETNADCASTPTAYRKRALRTHPDRGGDEQEFKRLAA